MKINKGLKNIIYVNRPTLPPLDKYFKYLKEIWDSKWITNNGKFHQKFENDLCKFLKVGNCSLFVNGTLALIIGLKTLGLKGEVITTPFSFVATTHAIHWNNLKPIFCDIEEKTFNIDPEKIESLITSKTSAILPVHVYGNPCNVEKIKEISDKYGLKVIYDSAHAFNTKIHNNSILNYGDISILSFHATKLFNTIEGGAVITNNKKLKKQIDFFRNFGFSDENTVLVTGLNGKMNELQAAYGLLELKIVNKEIEKRKKIAYSYKKNLNDIKGIKTLEENKDITYSYTYFPILIDENEYGKTRDQLYKILRRHNIYSKRYFYPLISKFKPYNKLSSASSKNLPIAEKISNQVLCLPFYGNIQNKELDKIISIIANKK